MTATQERKLRVTLVGGFLGSGKTTWLRHQLHIGRYPRALVIVNEAAGTPIDDLLLQQSHRLVVLAGGCACCQAKAALVGLLRNISDEHSRDESLGKRLEEIVIETSGLADPASIAAAIRDDSVLVHHLVVREVVVLVDAVNAWSQLCSETLGRRQLEVADRMIVSKVEAADPGRLCELLSALTTLNPGATLTGTTWGSEVRLPPPARGVPALRAPPEAAGGGGAICVAKIALDRTVDWVGFSLWLSALLHARSEDVLRVKGVVRTPAGRLLLQAVRGVVPPLVVLPPRGGDSESADDTMVIIGRRFDQGSLSRSVRNFLGSGSGRRGSQISASALASGGSLAAACARGSGRMIGRWAIR